MRHYHAHSPTTLVRYKAVEVYVDNAPSQWHVHYSATSMQWGRPSLYVAASREEAFEVAARMNAGYAQHLALAGAHA